jgi:hypothetical protein
LPVCIWRTGTHKNFAAKRAQEVVDLRFADKKNIGGQKKRFADKKMCMPTFDF